MIPYPDFDPIAFTIGPVAIRWYGLMYLVGFIGGWWLMNEQVRRLKLRWTHDDVSDLLFYCALGVIIGGRLGSAFFYNWNVVLEDPLWVVRLWEPGMSFHGGLLGVLGAAWWYARQTGRRFFDVMDLVAPAVPLGLGAGRIGNFINGELWGKPSTVPWAFIVDGPNGQVALHPSQLYEFALEGVVMFAVLWTFARRPRPTMAVAGLFALLYGVFRILVEFVRVPDAHIGYLYGDWLTMGQVLSLPLAVTGLVLLALAYWRPTYAPSRA